MDDVQPQAVSASAAPSRLALTQDRGARLYHLEGARDGAPLAAVLASLGLEALPAMGRSGGTGEAGMLAIGPDIFFMVTRSPPPADLAQAFAAAVDLSDGWMRIVVTGANAPDLLAAGCALDLHPRAFPPGACAMTGFAGMRTLVWRSAGDRFDLLVGRSYARSMWDWLMESAAEFGVFAPAQER
jgi:sarcosine oxidase subunit gamma